MLRITKSLKLTYIFSHKSHMLHKTMVRELDKPFSQVKIWETLATAKEGVIWYLDPIH